MTILTKLYRLIHESTSKIHSLVKLSKSPKTIRYNGVSILIQKDGSIDIQVPSDLHIETIGDIWINGKTINLNCDKNEPHPLVIEHTECSCCSCQQQALIEKQEDACSV